MTTDRETLRDLIEERAAILEFDAGMNRAEAELSAAQMHGFKDWRAAMTQTKET
jgi:hypothetical protein